MPNGQQWHPVPSDIIKRAADPKRAWGVLAYTWAWRAEYEATNGGRKRPSAQDMVDLFGANRTACTRLLRRVRGDFAHWEAGNSDAAVTQERRSSDAAVTQPTPTSTTTEPTSRRKDDAAVTQERRKDDARARSLLFTTTSTTKDPPTPKGATSPKKPDPAAALWAQMMGIRAAGKTAQGKRVIDLKLIGAHKRSLQARLKQHKPAEILEGWRLWWTGPEDWRRINNSIKQFLQQAVCTEWVVKAAEGAGSTQHTGSAQSGSSVSTLGRGQKGTGMDETRATELIRAVITSKSLKRTIEACPEGEREAIRAAFKRIGDSLTIRTLATKEIPWRAKEFRDTYNQHRVTA